MTLFSLGLRGTMMIMACGLGATACAQDVARDERDGVDSMVSIEDDGIEGRVLYACTCTGSDGIKRSYIKEVIGGVLVEETRPCDRNGVCVRERRQ